MENLLHVGNKVDKDTINNLKEIIETIFTEGHKNHMEQKTIVAALRMVGMVTEVKHVTITNSVFRGDNVVNMNDSEQ